MFIVEINSNQLMNAGQIPTNRRDHVGVPKFEVTTRVSTHSVTGSGSRENTVRWRKHSKVLVASLVPAVSKSTKHSPESLSISSLGCHRRRSRIRPPFRYFYEKILAKNCSTPKYCRQHVFNSQVTNRIHVVNIIDSASSIRRMFYGSLCEHGPALLYFGASAGSVQLGRA